MINNLVTQLLTCRITSAMKLIVRIRHIITPMSSAETPLIKFTVMRHQRQVAYHLHRLSPDLREVIGRIRILLGYAMNLDKFRIIIVRRRVHKAIEPVNDLTVSYHNNTHRTDTRRIIVGRFEVNSCEILHFFITFATDYKVMNYFDKIDNVLFEYVEKHKDDDLHALRLASAGRQSDIDIDTALTQIEGMRKARHKLEAFIQMADGKLLYPSATAVEQATHQSVALYHAHLARNAGRVLDMTAGLGIDSMAMALAGNDVIAYELDPQRAEALKYNCTTLALHITVRNEDSVEALRQQAAEGETPFDLIFVDPARRDGANNRTFFFRDCLPDITSCMDVMCRMARRILVKASPIVDLKQAVAELPHVAAIHLVCVKGECKEVLIDIRPQESTRNVRIIAIDLETAPLSRTDFGNDNEFSKLLISRFECNLSDVGIPAPIVQTPPAEGMWLYDPNAAIHKLNAPGALTSHFEGLQRVSPNTGLYVSELCIEGFPGRRLLVTDTPTGKQLKALRSERYNIATRNYPLTADQLRNKLKVKEGTDNFIYGLRWGTAAKPVLLTCHKE